MRKIALVLVMLGFALQATAIDIVLSDEDLRFSESDSAESFSVTLSDDPTKLAVKDGNIKAKLKFNKKLFESSQKGAILIPYTDGVVGYSDPITLSLKNSDDIEVASTSNFSIVVPKGIKKRLKVDNYKDSLSIDAGAVTISGRVQLPSGSSSSFKTRRARLLNPLNTSPEADVEITVVEVAADGTETETGFETTTDADGGFVAELPLDAQPGAEYAIVAHNQDNPEDSLRAPAVQPDEDEPAVVDVVSNFIQEQIEEGFQNEEISQENLDSTEVIDIIESFTEFNPGREETVAESKASLDALFPPVIDNMLGVADDPVVEVPDQLPEEDDDEPEPEPEPDEPDEGNSDDDGGDDQPDQPEEDDSNDDGGDDQPDQPEEDDSNDDQPEQPEEEEEQADPLEDEDFEFETTPTELGLAAEEIAGDYFVVFYEGALGASNSLSPFGEEHRVSAELELGLARLSRPSEAGVLTVTPKPVLFSEASLFSNSNEGGGSISDGDEFGEGPGEGEFGEGPEDGEFGEGPEDGDHGGPDDGFGQGPQDGSNCYSLEAFSGTPELRDGEAGGFLATVDTNDVMSVVVPASEETHTHHGPNGSISTTIRDKDEVFQFYPVSGGFSIANNTGGGEEFNADTNVKISEDTIIGYQIAIKQSDETLEGLYGLVGVGTDLSGQGRIGVMNIKGTLDIAAGGTVVYSFDAGTELQREYTNDAIASCDDSFDVSVSTGADEFSQPETGTAQFTTRNGRMTIDLAHEEEEEGQMVFEGYASQDTSIAAFVIATDRNDQGGVARRPNQIDSASRELSFAVKLPSSTPSPSGTYKIFSYSTSLGTDGSIVLSSHKTGNITFTGTSFSIAGTLENQALKAGGSSAHSATTASSDFEGASGTATISETGEISFTAGGHSFSGYVQDGGNAIVTFAHDSSNTMGLFLFVKQ